MKLTVSFFDRGPSCPTDRTRSPFFGFVLFVLFIFYFWLVFFSLVPDCTTTQRKFSPVVKYLLFRCSVYLFWVATVFFLFFPCTHSLWFTWIPCNEASACRVSIKQTNKHSGQVEQASMLLRRRSFHHKDDDTREALPATLSSPKFSWSSSEIVFLPSDLFFTLSTKQISFLLVFNFQSWTTGASFFPSSCLFWLFLLRSSLEYFSFLSSLSFSFF